MAPAPVRKQRSKADHVNEGPAHDQTTRGELAIVAVEVAMHGDAAGLGEGDRLADLPAFEVPFPGPWFPLYL